MPRPHAYKHMVQHLLEELLENQDFLKVIALAAKEVMRFWNVQYLEARRFVLSAIGEPETLMCIHRAWVVAEQTGERGLAKVIVRRRVIDLLRKDARPTGHCSLSATEAALEVTGSLDAADALLEGDPRAQLELQEIRQLVRDAVACFATQGRTQQRQAQLLRRYVLDNASYSELAVEMASSEGALRVRVHKAMLALRLHIGDCHPELEELMDRDPSPRRPGHHMAL